MKKFYLTTAVLFAVIISSLACTNLIVGKKASADGSTIVSYSADSYGMFGDLYHSPAAKYEKGAKLDIYNWEDNRFMGTIDQARETYNVIGNINEYQVTIAETTFGGRPELEDTTGIIDYGSLIRLGLQRSKSAKEAIKVMTSLVQEYGYASGGESFTIADPNEIWIMEMMGKGPGIKGAVWVAVRVPDDCISAHANQSRIHSFDMNDKNNCMYSPDVISFAREKGYFDGVNKDFSFSKAYNPLDFGGRRFCEARVWSYFNMFTDQGENFLPYILGDTDEPMPLFIKPNKKVSVQDVRDAMRDHYEGTQLDISQDFGAGAYNTPYRLSPLTFKYEGEEYFNERPISTQQSAWVFVSQMRSTLPNAIGGVFWFGLDDANMTVFTPVYCSATEVPDSYAANGADYVTFSWDSAFWIYQWVSNMVYPRYGLMINDLRKVQNELETYYEQNQAGVEKVASDLYAKNPEEAVKFLTSYTKIAGQQAFESWKKLGEYLIVKYNDGVVTKTNKDGSFERNKIGEPTGVVRPGYTEKFLKDYIEQTGERYKVK
ncbi:peptidase U34 dipeptidase [Bacteroides coprosuis DSM 18011]|uniref:Dipeptidase n=1 Tax=Bacteroides coprosuis DSM 18011 TaxID=679937 RepID=F3ZTQ6_9BACE|nr:MULTISPECIES: C69 family dipeptidase [Bacteroides]EGJ71287.1 peptidase U34 dipeptidase [Bacteroides coprosuis DSM 18011]HJD93080.1 C69 family dipeptidase [Bacteroides coprosuis]